MVRTFIQRRMKNLNLIDLIFMFLSLNLLPFLDLSHIYLSCWSECWVSWTHTFLTRFSNAFIDPTCIPRIYGRMSLYKRFQHLVVLSFRIFLQLGVIHQRRLWNGQWLNCLKIQIWWKGHKLKSERHFKEMLRKQAFANKNTFSQLSKKPWDCTLHFPYYFQGKPGNLVK